MELNILIMVFLASFLIKFDDVNLKFDMSRYGYPMRIQSRFSEELLQLFALYLHWWENESTSFWKWNKI